MWRKAKKQQHTSPVVTDGDGIPHTSRTLWHAARKVFLTALAVFALLRPVQVAMTDRPAPSATPEATPTEELALPAHFSSRLSSTTCTPLGDAAAKKDFAPIADVFTRVSRQTISGTPVVTKISTNGKTVTLCISREMPEGNIVATYEATTRRLIFKPRAVIPATIAHEMFHKHQHDAGGFISVGSNSRLAATDRADAMLLVEATAAAYGMVVIKEMEFTDRSYARQHIAANDYGMSELFEARFSQAYTSGSGLDETARRRQALEFAGQSVVRALMRGESLEWRDLYRNQAASYLGQPSYTGPQDAAYTQTRDRLFADIGRVTDGLQLVPPEFFGAQADETLRTTERLFRLQAPKTAGKKPQAPKAG